MLKRKPQKPKEDGSKEDIATTIRQTHIGTSADRRSLRVLFKSEKTFKYAFRICRMSKTNFFQIINRYSLADSDCYLLYK